MCRHCPHSRLGQPPDEEEDAAESGGWHSAAKQSTGGGVAPRHDVSMAATASAAMRPRGRSQEKRGLTESVAEPSSVGRRHRGHPSRRQRPRGNGHGRPATTAPNADGPAASESAVAPKFMDDGTAVATTTGGTVATVVPNGKGCRATAGRGGGFGDSGGGGGNSGGAKRGRRVEAQ